MTPPNQRPHKARIFVLKELAAGTADKPATVKVTGVITVQFNPTSLKIERNNDTSSGAVVRAQRRTQTNEGHAILSLELEYDTAEGGPDGKPLDVRKKTAEIRQFVEPPKDKTQKAPPRLRFVWGKLIFDGTVTRVSEDIDYFSNEGLALRAKVSLSITEQNLRFERNASGPGARTDSTATQPGGGQGSTGPNAPPAGNPDTAVAAQDGESLQQLLSRLGLDPETWRTAMAGLDSPLALAAGAQVQLSAAASAGAGIGVSAGFSAGPVGVGRRRAVRRGIRRCRGHRSGRAVRRRSRGRGRRDLGRSEPRRRGGPRRQRHDRGVRRSSGRVHPVRRRRGRRVDRPGAGR